MRKLFVSVSVCEFFTNNHASVKLIFLELLFFVNGTEIFRALKINSYFIAFL